MNKTNQEWRSVSIKNEKLDFSGATKATLDHAGDSFVSLTFRLKSGQIVRVRKSDYSISIEAMVIPSKTVFIAKTKSGLSSQFDNEEDANKAIEDIDGEVTEMSIPIQQQQLEEILPF